MKVPQELMDKWKALRSQGDSARILEKIEGEGYSDETINRALRNGACNPEVFKAIADYYEEKAAMIASYLPAKV
jgi:hypothetical protein